MIEPNQKETKSKSTKETVTELKEKESKEMSQKDEVKLKDMKPQEHSKPTTTPEKDKKTKTQGGTKVRQDKEPKVQAVPAKEERQTKVKETNTNLVPKEPKQTKDSDKKHEENLKAQSPDGNSDISAIQKDRQARMKAMCARLHPRGSQLEILERRLSQVFVDEGRRFIYCAVPKAGCTTMKRALVESSGRIPLDEMKRRTQQMIGGL